MESRRQIRAHFRASGRVKRAAFPGPHACELFADFSRNGVMAWYADEYHHAWRSSILLNASTTRFPAGDVDRFSGTASLRASVRHSVRRHRAGKRDQILLEGIRIGHLYLSDDVGWWHCCLRMGMFHL
jgi:hypothetical protein